MSTLYETLCTVRTELLNVITAKYIFGNNKVYVQRALESIVSNMDHMSPEEFTRGIRELTESELLNLGFQYSNKSLNNMMMFPIWIYELIPDSTQLIYANGDLFIKGFDPIALYCDSWLNVGFIQGCPALTRQAVSASVR